MRNLYDWYGVLLKQVGKALSHPLAPALAPEGTLVGGDARSLPALGWSRRCVPALESDGDAELGYGLLERWRASVHAIGVPVEGDTNGTMLRVRTVVTPGTPPATHPHTACDVTNLYVDYSRIGWRGDVRHRPGYLRTPQAYPDYGRRALFGACRIEGTSIDLDLFPRDHLRDIFDSFVACEPTEVPVDVETVTHPVLFLTREPGERGNLFHAHTDFLAAFAMLHLFGLSPDETQVVLLDNNPTGPFDEVFRRAFSRQHPVMRVGDHGARTVCYRRAVFVPPGYSSLLFANMWDPAPVTGSLDLLIDYGRFLLQAYGIERAAPARLDEPVAVTVVSRRPYVGGVDRSYLRNQFHDEDALVAALGAVAGVRVARVDFASLPIDAQLRAVARTELLIGAHGAALAHMLCMREHGAVLEIVGDESEAAIQLYPHMATWSGRALARVRARRAYGLFGSYLRPDLGVLQQSVRALAERIGQRRRHLIH